MSDGKPLWFAGERRTRTLGGSVRKRERGGRWDVGRTWEGVCALLRASEREAEVAGEWPFPSRRRADAPTDQSGTVLLRGCICIRHDPGPAV